MNDIYTLIFLAFALAMDAFAVSICRGLSMDRINFGRASVVGLWFGIFQGIMPVAGYFLGKSFRSFLMVVDHWLAFILLLFIGVNMIREAAIKRKAQIEGTADNLQIRREANPLAFRTMFIMAIATSIDALAVGLSMAMAESDSGCNIWVSAAVIALVTYLLSVVGVKAGAHFGHKYEYRAEFVGGILLILIGARVLVEHLFGL